MINDQLPKSSYPSAVTELILVCYLAVAFGVPETIVVFAIASSNKVKEEAMEEEAEKLLKRGEEEEEGEEGGDGDLGFGQEQHTETATELDKKNNSPVEKDSSGMGIDHSMSIVMKVMRRKKSQKIPFIIDMSCLILVVIVVVVSCVIIIAG